VECAVNINQLFLSALLGGITTLVFAKSPASHSNVTREVAFDSCHFTVEDPYEGTLQSTRYSSPALANYNSQISPLARHRFETWIQFYCEKNGAEKAFKSMGMKRDDVRWVRSEGRYPSLPEEHVTIYPLHGASWSGAGLSSDQTTGEFDQRMRSFGFCIAGKHQVLCGAVQQVMFLRYPKESTLPQVIKLLQSIEFIDDAPGASDTATSANQ
jgi:hypothetical protein